METNLEQIKQIEQEVIVVITPENEIFGVYTSNDEMRCGLHNAGIRKEVKLKAVVGKVKFNAEDAEFLIFK